MEEWRQQNFGGDARTDRLDAQSRSESQSSSGILHIFVFKTNSPAHHDSGQKLGYCAFVFITGSSKVKSVRTEVALRWGLLSFSSDRILLFRWKNECGAFQHGQH